MLALRKCNVIRSVCVIHNHFVYNFSSGPACLPAEVVAKIKADIPDWSQGVSVMEISHRSSKFMGLMQTTEQKLKKLLNIPDDFCILFMHGGARAQFAAVALNLFYQNSVVDYLLTGHWSEEARKEASKYINVHVAADGKTVAYKSIPQFSQADIHPDSNYVHYTDNETIHGIEFREAPNTKQLLIADMTSSILSKPIEWNKFALVYASAQKNLGIAGVTVAILRKSLLNQANPLTPAVMSYQTMAETQSLYNTCPVFPIYVLSLILEWAEQLGGVAYFEEKAKRVSSKLYQCIDESSLYTTPVDVEARSRMNVPFSLRTTEMEVDFLKRAEKQGLLALQGHRVVGGARASIYNAMPEEGVDALVAFMRAYERENN